MLFLNFSKNSGLSIIESIEPNRPKPKMSKNDNDKKQTKTIKSFFIN